MSEKMKICFLAYAKPEYQIHRSIGKGVANERTQRNRRDVLVPSSSIWLFVERTSFNNGDIFTTMIIFIYNHLLTIVNPKHE